VFVCLATTLALVLVAPAERSLLSGQVRDVTGGAIASASVSLLSPEHAVVATAQSDAHGTFQLADVPPGSYVLVVESPGFARKRTALTVDPRQNPGLRVVLEPEAFTEEVTVTASPGRVQELSDTTQRVNVIEQEEIAYRAKAVVAQVAEGEAGVHFQRTSPTMGGLFVRGLTGTKVNVYVDGVRYTTGAQRGGVSTFLNLVDPASLEAVEVLRGPSSAEYGSDALGGSLQFLTRSPGLSADGPRLGGSWSTTFGSADVSYGSSLSTSYADSGFGLVATLAGRRNNTVRPGGGFDSHNAATRFLGLPSAAVIGERLPDTAFTQYGGHLKTTLVVSPTSRLVGSYLRAQQDGGKRYDQLLGGDGNLVADLRNLMQDSAFVRWERSGSSWFDRLTLGYSFGAQREERVTQGGNGNPRASINHEPERTVVHGGRLLLTKNLGVHALSFGGDYQHEAMSSPSFGFNPVTGATTLRRGRVPDGSRFDTGGVWVQDAFETLSGKLRLLGALRWGGARYSAEAADAPVVNGEPLWPDDSLDSSSLTFRAGAVATAGAGLSVIANVARGFRSPNITDLGTFGLTGSGFEVSNREVEGLGATVGTTADSAAVSTGAAVTVLSPETSLSYELTLRYERRRLRTELTGFLNDIDDNVAKQALILPAGAVGSSLAGEPIVRQLPSGVVFVAASTNPVLVRANFDRARIWGVEYALDWAFAADWSTGGVFTYLHAEDRTTGLPPNIEGGTPAPDGYLRLRYAPAGARRFWVEPYLHAAGRQSRLSSLDLGDRRTGAGRSRSNIAAFFGNGATARGLVADDVLLATGETLAQVQDRVLGPGVSSAPLFSYIPGYVTFGVRGALRFAGRHEVLVDFENVGDRNYRGISWGMDAPGRNLFLRYRMTF
jgi:outer membrane receptor protein involved in Fe transport